MSIGKRAAKGVTLLEVLTTIAIVSVIFAITLPVFRSAKRSALEASARRALHQNWMALEIYRQDWGGGQDFGTSVEMALPLDSTGYKNPVKPPFRNPIISMTGYIIYPKQKGVSSDQLVDEWVSYSRMCRSSSILLADFNFNDFDVWNNGGMRPKKGIGVLVSGSIVTRIKEGAQNIPYWWDCRGAQN